MARSTSLVAWAVVFGFLTAATLSAAEKKPPKPPAEKSPAQFAVHAADDADPFASDSSAPSHPKQAPKKHQPQKAVAKMAKPPKPAAALPQKPWQKGAAEAAIEKALATTTQLDFCEAPLQDVIDYLKEVHGIEIQLDKTHLDDVSASSETPVTINVKGLCLKSALSLMLRRMQPELTYIIKNEVLLITTPDIADEELELKLYDVADLVVCQDDRDQLWDDYAPLIDIITSTIKPTTWISGGSSVCGNSIGTAKVLVVSQTQEVHEEIADLLVKIREIAKKNPKSGTPRRIAEQVGSLQPTPSLIARERASTVREAVSTLSPLPLGEG
jgi:hypothetical protein